MPRFEGRTGQTLQIRLQSSLLDIGWGTARAAQGGFARLEVATHWVADGSEARIAIRDLEGRILETLKGAIFSNLFRIPYHITQTNTTGGMYFEVDLPAHGLKGSSPRLAIAPPIGIAGLNIRDDQGREVKTLSQPVSLQLSGKVEGAAEGSPCRFSLYSLSSDGHTHEHSHNPSRLVHAAETRVKGGMASCMWKFTPPAGEQAHTGQAGPDEQGEGPARVQYLFELECLGVKGTSRTMEFEGGLEKVVGRPSKEPPWMKIAWKEIGQKETPGLKAHNARILEYHATTTMKASNDEVAWCSSFVNWVMEQAGYKGTKSAQARDWAKWGKTCQEPLLGSICVIEYGGLKGHVGFVAGKNAKGILLLGGNQRNQVCLLPPASHGRILCYVMPSDYPDLRLELPWIEGKVKAMEYGDTR